MLLVLEKFLIPAGNTEVFDGNERMGDALKYLGLKNLNDIISVEMPLAHPKWVLEKEQAISREVALQMRFVTAVCKIP